MELRVEYKALVKTGADRKGVNVAKREFVSVILFSSSF
jgi:hypothetical protein